MQEIKVGDIVTFDPSLDDTPEWILRWGDKFLVIGIDGSGYPQCIPLENNQWNHKVGYSGERPAGKPPWNFYGMVRDDFLTAVYKERGNE